MSSIRLDERQWMIFDEESVTAVVGAVEALLVGLGAAALRDHADQQVRAIGAFGEKLAETRLAHWSGQLAGLEPSEVQKQLVAHLYAVSAYLVDEGERPETALDDIQAALVWIDKRAKGAGVVGDGWYREIVRESTLGR